VLCFCALAFGETIFERVNRMQSSWIAGPVESSSAIKKYAGTFMDDPHPLPKQAPIVRATPPPPTFDSRTQWPGCIGPVLDQGECGSCWAFGTAETLSDRFCIHSNGSVVVALSELDLVSCDTQDSGCEGGAPSTAWQYAKTTGLVENSCIPYNDSIPTCPPATEPCLTFVPTPACPGKCSNGANWKNDKHFAASGYSVGSHVVEIQNEMLTNGPVQASFNCYEDFIHYKSGVYKHTTGQLLGGHSVKIIGWGTLNGQDYWLVQNSWTAVWGENGFFMILRGVNECGIESGIVAGLPSL